MNLFFPLICLLCFCSQVYAAKRGPGSCADQKVTTSLSTFDQNKLKGRWYEIARDSSFSDPTKSCQVEDFVVNTSGTVTIAKNDYTVDGGWVQKPIDAILIKGATAQYNLFTATEKPDSSGKTDFRYLATDYDTYLIEYICVDVIIGKLFFESISVKSKRSQLDQATRDKVLKMIGTLVPAYDVKDLFNMHQCLICPYKNIKPTLPKA